MSSRKQSVFEAYERTIHGFLELGRHIGESIKTSFESIRDIHFTTYNIEIAVFGQRLQCQDKDLTDYRRI